MKRVMPDTNAYTALMGGNRDVADILNSYPVILMSPVVIGELLDGFIGGRRRTENRKILERFLEKPRTTTLAVTLETSEFFAEIKRQLRRKGQPIPINDVWIAASCMEHGAHLLTFDGHFSHIDGLIRI